MKRHIICDEAIADTLLATGKCIKHVSIILICEDSLDDMKALQSACDELTKDSEYKNYKLLFAKANDYSDFITV